MNTKQQRIFFVLPHANLRGGNKIVFEVADGLTDHGYSITILTPTGHPPAWMNVKTPFGSWDHWRKRITDDDIAIMTWDYDADYLMDIRGYKGYYVQHFMHFIEDIFKLPLDFFVSESSYIQKHTLETYGVRSHLIMPGIAHTVFQPYPDVPRIGNRVMTLGWGGWKGTEDVEKAIELVRAQGQPVDFTSVHDLSSEEMARAYCSSAVYVSGSWYEGFGLPLLEAMACGCPVATTDSKGIDDFAIDGETCLKVPPRDPEAMAAAVLHLLRDPGLRRRLAANGLAMAQRFGWERSIDAWEELLGLRSGRPHFLEAGDYERLAAPSPETRQVIRRVRQTCARRRREERLARIKSALRRVLPFR
ncbi:MAG: glycosyltransferase family 4 protein [Dehalococcoidia bacterium]|nr:glycosyltransferase family 4 protein [Dehalococcoidia bacterium]